MPVILQAAYCYPRPRSTTSSSAKPGLKSCRKVPDARVFIQGNGKRTPFSYAGVMGPYENTGHPLQVQPATDYYLEVQIPNERDFFGPIVTPGLDGFLNIAERDTRTKNL